MKQQRQRQRRRRRHSKKEKYIEPLSNFDILDLAAILKIPHFHGVFMRDTLRNKVRPAAQECWVLNHSSSNKNGTHWTCLAKNFNEAFHFDSMGRLAPPLEVLNYLGNNINLYYNAKRYQNYGTTVCGHLCLRFLYDFWRNVKNMRRKNKKYIKTRSLL